MRKIIISLFIIFVILILILFVIFYLRESRSNFFFSPLGPPIKKLSRSYSEYTFDSLTKRQFSPEKITIGDLIDKGDGYAAYFFYYSSSGKKVSGAINLPDSESTVQSSNLSQEGEPSDKISLLPIIIMIRGYADKEIYFTGLGTRKAASVFAQNGFVSLAPDFLGFGQSDDETLDILQNRFQRPETVLNLLASLVNLNQSFEEKGLLTRIDPQKVFLWGHSNGGQIAISILEITRRTIPTVLWAPVTADFPESILNYAREEDEGGRMVIQVVKDLQSITDPKNFSIGQYLSQIQGPLQIHQGTADEYLPKDWTDSFISRLKENGKTVTFFSYYKDNHNLQKNWDLVIQRDLHFYQSYL